MEFLDRESELEVLRGHLKRPGAGLFVLYGRRRIGKTALLNEALKGVRRSVYHVGTRSTVSEELGRLSLALAQGLDAPLLAAQPLTSSQALIAFLEGVTGPAVLVLDEFPYLVESDPSLPGLLQAAWDRRLSRSGMKLVFCGSSIGMMEGIFLSKGSPLFGRRTGQLRLGPLPPGVLRRAFHWKPAEVLELYATFGGVPGYLARLDPKQDLFENLCGSVLTRGEPLYEELPFLLREELREPRVYHAILAAIAAGARKFGEVSSKVGLDKANLTRYLSILIDLNLVEREVPITERMPDKSRKGIYRIADPFVATWFSLVHPFRDALERGQLDQALKRQLRARLQEALPRAVEPVVRELLREEPLSAQVPFQVAHAGRHWSDKAEFDVVFLDQDRKRAFVGEVKWTRGKVGRHAIDGLRARVKDEQVLIGLDCTFALIARDGFTGRREAAPDERFIDLGRPG